MAKTVNLTAVEKLSTYNEHTNLIVEQEGELNRVAIANLKISSSEIYKQDEEPIDAPEGALWIDTDEESNFENGLPEVTTEDNGKFLRVVDGAWVAVSVPNAEEASF